MYIYNFSLNFYKMTESQVLFCGITGAWEPAQNYAVLNIFHLNEYLHDCV